MSLRKIAYITLLAAGLSGCISPKTYVDPSFSKASYNDIRSVADKYETQIAVEFQRNGKPFERVNSEVRGHVERTLRATGIISPSIEDSSVSITVVVNNIADMGEAAAKGFGTGLTFGAAGSLVTDYYEIKIELTDSNGDKLTENYKHALHTTIGNKDAPFQDIEATTPADGFGRVVEQTLLNFLKDMQAKGLLTLDIESLRVYS